VALKTLIVLLFCFFLLSPGEFEFEVWSARGCDGHGGGKGNGMEQVDPLVRRKAGRRAAAKS
jgi:hypothetical protein